MDVHSLRSAEHAAGFALALADDLTADTDLANTAFTYQAQARAAAVGRMAALKQQMATGPVGAGWAAWMGFAPMTGRLSA